MYINHTLKTNMDTTIKIEEAKLQIHIEYSKKIELGNYIDSLNSINNEYTQYIHETPNHLDPEEIKLLVNEIRTGSIITELITFSPTLLPFIENTNTILDFTKHIANVINLLKSKNNIIQNTEQLPSTNTLTNIQGLVSPILNDPKGKITLEGCNFGDNCNVSIFIDSNEARKIHAKAQEIKNFKPTPDSNIKEQVLLFFTQTNGSTKNINSDKGVIESISKGSVKVRFASNELKRSMLLEQHPYKVAYIVDVEIETVDNKPRLYKVLKFHEYIDLSD